MLQQRFQKRYEKTREEILSDSNINPDNKKLMVKFLDYQEIKLRRKNHLPNVDEKSYKTLYFYLGRLKRLNRWFENKSWKDLTEIDIKKLIDDLEDGNIVTERHGQRLSDRSLYYQMMTGYLFKLINKTQIVKNYIDEFSISGRNDNNQPRFIREDEFRKVVNCAISPEQKCLLWLAFDIGENIDALLNLKKSDFTKQLNPDTKEPEYHVRLKKDNIKRSRTARVEPTNYLETYQFLDIVLQNIKPSKKLTSNKYQKNQSLNLLHDDDKLFKFGVTAAYKFLKRAVKLSAVNCEPDGQEVTWKDLRSSMACDLLIKGWTTDEIKARLGHTPSSRMIDKYVNYLALERAKPQKKMYDSNIKRLEEDLEKQRDVNKLQGKRVEDIMLKLKYFETLFEKLEKEEVPLLYPNLIKLKKSK